jgi:hypothetical protein
MLELVNNTLWSAGLYPGWDRYRRPQMTLVIKAGFWFSERGELTPMKNPPPIEESDRFYEESGDSSLAAACDTVPYKNGAELLVYGTAYPPQQDSSMMEVSLGLRRNNEDYWQKSLRVFGPRSWHRGLTGVSLGRPESLEPLPLRYEFAYGGSDPRNEMQQYDKNPVGAGYSHRSRYHSALGVPQIEISSTFLRSLTQRPEPGGFGPIPTFWEPRIRHQPNMDEGRQSMGLCPFLDDVNPAFYNAAPPDQRFSETFAGTESILLKGLLNKRDGDNAVLIHLPLLSPKIDLQKGGERKAITAQCDTLVVNADAREIHLVWRAGISQSLTDTTPGWVILEEDRSSDEEASKA